MYSIGLTYFSKLRLWSIRLDHQFRILSFHRLHLVRQLFHDFEGPLLLRQQVDQGMDCKWETLYSTDLIQWMRLAER